MTFLNDDKKGRVTYFWLKKMLIWITIK